MHQLTDSTSALTLAKTYDPYGNVATSNGSSATAYGFTAEYQSRDSVYLRSRHYAPAMGRFLSRDTWAGDANHPLSFNRWNYTFSNPVNLTDPSGYFPPFWCQKMTSEYAYDECVSKYYKIEPINYYGEFVKKVNHGIRIKGFDGNLHDFSFGCYYHGPTKYRAKGYVEGTGLTFATGLSWYYALDSVYDFATMQHEYFITDGNKQMGQMFRANAS